MQKLFLFIGVFVANTLVAFADEPDSVYLFSYATAKNNHHNGLHFAWSRDREHWHSIGNDYGFVKSDYGPWGAEKKMFAPALLQGPNGTWQCVWSLNEKENVFAHASSHDLVDWGRQSYPRLKSGTNFLRPVLSYNQQKKVYTVTYVDGANNYYQVATIDFKTYTPAVDVPASQYQNRNITIHLQGDTVTGQVHRVAWTVADKLIKSYELQQYKSSLHSESAKDDAVRFAGLAPVKATISVQPQKAKPISDLLMGIFFEDINYAADGGLYAELVQNRGFEYDMRDKGGRDKEWTATHSWTLKGENTVFTIDSIAPLHVNNPHYAVLETKVPGAALVNAGFEGMVVRKGERYDLSLFIKQIGGKGGKMLARLVNKKGEVLGQTTVTAPTQQWKQTTAVLVASADANDAALELQPQAAGKLALDMISLFPQKTFKSRKNGLRPDLAQAIADIQPRFVRFPGGCVAHGDGLGNIYRWKGTVGPLQARQPQRNIWNYHQSMGLGYFEYFQFCEDIGAIPLPVIAAGVPCQNSAVGGAGQQGGIPIEQMDEYIQDILDLVEWANGDANTKWGRVRAAAGHPAPFNLKYIGIGNEDLITDVFEERFTMIYKALRKKHPELTIIGTVGPFYLGTDYEEGWELATKLKVPMVDEHYYESPGWFVHNQDFYDRYDRTKSKVYLGEYASRGNTLYNALAEAAYLTALERNGDVVHMASYAPLLAKEGYTQWNPDLIYFNNAEVKPTINYEVQKLFGVYAGDVYLPATISLSNNQEAVRKRVSYSIVRDTKSNDLIVKMVNLLPVAVSTSLNFSGVALAGTKARKMVLQGAPEEKSGKVTGSDVSVSDSFDSELPPYSFTVLRIKTKGS